MLRWRLSWRGVRPSHHQCPGASTPPLPSKVGLSPPEGVIWAYGVVVTQLSPETSYPQILIAVVPSELVSGTVEE